MQRIDRYVGIGIALLGSAILWSSRSFPNVPNQKLGASTIPGIVGVGLLICALLLVWRSFASTRYAVQSQVTADRERLGPPLAMLAAILVYLLLSERLGYPIVAPLSVLIGLLALGVRPKAAIGWAIGASALVHLAFYKLLKVPLPWGVIPPLY